jgi:hypothetical protein
MYVVVVHDIHDSEKFWRIVENVVDTDAVPDNVNVHACYPDASGSRAVCLQEASSIEPVRDWIEGTFGVVSTNQYFEVQACSPAAVGLPV